MSLCGISRWYKMEIFRLGKVLALALFHCSIILVLKILFVPCMIFYFADTLERLVASSSVELGLPKFAGVQLPPPAAGPGPAGAASSHGNQLSYAMTPEDHFKYHTLFQNYDTNHDG